MRHINLILTLFGIATAFGSVAQKRVVEYQFSGNLNPIESNAPSLKVVGQKGVFIEEPFAEYANLEPKAYHFSANSGLVFDNRKSDNLLSNSYTIEMFVKLNKTKNWNRILDFKNRKTDEGLYVLNGKANFYKNKVSDKTSFFSDKYTHLVITRNHLTKETVVYANGQEKFHFFDWDDHAVLEENGELIFFQDDLADPDEASAGTIAFVKLYNYQLEPNTVWEAYDDIQNTTKQPLPTSGIIVKGVVINHDNEQGIDATINILNIHTGQKIAFFHTNPSLGTYKTKLEQGHKYLISVKAIGFMSKSDTIDITSTNTEDILHDFSLLPLEKGQSLILNNIKFSQGKYEILSSSYAELDVLVLTLLDNPTMEIELSGHTDGNGDPKLNMNLSLDRAKAVRDYLVAKGLKTNRIRVKGYGGSKPIASNQAEETRVLNRRVELTVLKY